MTTHAQVGLPRTTVQRRRTMLLAGVCGGVVILGGTFVALARSNSPMPLLLSMDPMRSEFVPSEQRAETKAGIEPQPSHVAANVALSLASDDLPSALSDENESTSTTGWFNGRQIRVARTIEMLVTAYSPDARSCGASADGITASGYSVWTNGMKLVAADTQLLPFGSLVSVPGYDDAQVVPVLDRGGAIKGNHIDVLFPSHEEAMEWGSQKLRVTVWEYADGKPADFRR